MSFEESILLLQSDAMPPAASPVAAPGARRRGLTGALRALLARWVEAETRRRSAKAMLTLPDHLLRDIGLSRGDLRSEARRTSRT